jgi:hypothetical protein
LEIRPIWTIKPAFPDDALGCAVRTPIHAKNEWSEKFKCALDISELISKQFYDQLLDIRRELRNFVAHGAFGKDGKAFNFHSGAGAVTGVASPSRRSQDLHDWWFLTFNDDAALGVIEKLIEHLWDGPRAPAKL